MPRQWEEIKKRHLAEGSVGSADFDSRFIMDAMSVDLGLSLIRRIVVQCLD
ncbi:hypothetical protein [Neokomagataea thailandica]|uniref:hypothetical protein n=1 Tax=Neokomagataea thailandica TaxID=661190 RepID=UPI0014714AC5|nr:hypothetical protein [Neokomagataea thailandica]